MIYLKIPASEILCVTYNNTKKETKFVITKSKIQNTYLLYSVSGEKLTKIGKAKSPIELETDYNIRDELISSTQSH